MKIWGIAMLLLGVQFSIFAQGDMTFIASSNADEVIPGQPFQVQFEIKNAELSSFNAPDFSPLKKISGPNVSSALRIINGRRLSTKTYSFTLSAPSAGSYTIPPATGKASGNVLRSNALVIEVVPVSKEGTSEEKGDVFLQLVPSDTSPFVGEQLVLDYVLYYSVPLENIYRLNKLDFSGFFSTNINDFPRSVNQTAINGEPYSRQIIKRVGLFGQQSGVYTFGPLFLRVDIAKGNRRSPFSVFRETEKKEIFAKPLTIHVQSLPEGAPANFSGGVGKFSIQARAEQQQLTMGEAVEVIVRVEGQSDPNVLDPPSLIIDGKAESYNPQLDYEDENVHRGIRSFTKSWTYLVVPEEEGKFSVQPYMIYLNTETGTYDSLMANQLELWAKPASSKKSDIITDSDGREMNKSNKNTWAWVLAAVLILAFIIALYYRFIKRKKPTHTPKDQFEQAAYFITQQRNNPPPDLGAIKQKLKQIKDLEDTHSIPEKTLNHWIEKLDYHQYSPVKNVENIKALLQEITDKLRKA